MWRFMLTVSCLSLLLFTPAKSAEADDSLPPLKIEDQVIFGCRNLEHVIEIVDLVKKKGPDAALRRYQELNKQPSWRNPLCSVERLGKVDAFEVIKTYPIIDFTFKQQIEVVVLRIEYHNPKRSIYITLERLVGEGQPI